ncbi:MAG TPA: SbmA/BacA-like family transporter [Gemmataceae bacterium]|nr:SbmA/BacA-like family transporter [Gemmataceae bacterium]
MSDAPATTNRRLVQLFLRAIRSFLTSEVRSRVAAFLALLVGFALAINGLNVVNSYVGRDFMTAIAHQDYNGFVRQAILYVAVFTASTVVAILYRFTEERFGVFWRVWLTERIVRRYMADRTYYRLKERGGVDNPDQRIADDVRTFTTTTLSFTLMFMNGVLAAISFSGVLWTISPLLFGVAVGYAVLGTLTAIYLGKPLVGLNYRQSDLEANFRADLIHARENAESVALLRREGRLTTRLLRRLDDLAANFRRITSVNRNLGFFTTGYNYLIQIIPALFVAPLFIRGEVEFGVITQAGVAFAQLLGAFSLIINQFQSLSSFTAVVARLGALSEAVEERQAVGPASIAIVEDPDRVAFEGLTLTSIRDGRLLLKELTVEIPHGTRVAIVGPDEPARVALFRATAGLGEPAVGRIVRPGFDQIMFISERPYVPAGTLRELLLRTGREREFSDEQILGTLSDLRLDPIVKRAGGLDREQDWGTVLTVTEQHAITCARILLARPRFAMFDRVGRGADPAIVKHVLETLTARSITYITLNEGAPETTLFDAVLELPGGGSWTWRPQAGPRSSALP